MAKKNKKQGMLGRIAGGGSNQGGRRRRSNRPRGEGRGLIDSVRTLLGRK